MDASDYAIGGVLYQMVEHDCKVVERPVAFNGRKYKGGEKNCSIREKELLANLFELRLWRVYLLDNPFIVEADHRSLESVFAKKIISRRISRWYDELSQYPVSFTYIPGATNTVAGGISRRAEFAEPSSLEQIVATSAIYKRVCVGLNAVISEAIARYKEDPIILAIIEALQTKPIGEKNIANPTSCALFARQRQIVVCRA
ncbi:unnamed protein product [Phytophthora fragariaefolia]|uniref:Unnamed protein product n=1 Tax=Phytophthora fragariaefolia TaxID=1490495 RepID=A0A9W6X3F6_9STRA|nr:unnamed protein product [Phytophthora fragariaefolia]